MNADDVATQAISALARALSLESAGASLQEVLQALVQVARLNAGPHSRTSLFILDESPPRIVLLATEGWSAQYASALKYMPFGDPIPCCQSAFLGDKLLIDDVAKDPAWAGHLDFARQHSIVACWSFPIHARGDKVVGALAACFVAPQARDTHAVAMMELLSRIAGLMIERHAQAADWRSAEAQLRESEARYRSLTKVLTSIVWFSDAQGRITAPQIDWSEYTGQSWEEQQGMGWLRAIHPDDREKVLAAVAQAIGVKAYYMAEGRVWHAATRTYRYCEAKGAPILDEKGEIVQWIGTCVDVDDHRRTEEELRAADRRKDEFIAVLAHELRNPLAPIRNASYILGRRGKGDAQLSWASTIIERQVGIMARLLEDLLDVSRITRDKLELRKTRVTLDSILESALETSRPLLEHHGHHLELNLLAGPLYIEADAARVAQAFSNLLNNAAKYTDRGGRVSLTVRLDGNHTVVSVKDNGIGIAPDMLPQLFRMFSQGSPGMERSQGGLGIGLALVRRVVEMHGGTVDAFSEGLGRGSEFVVRLPLAAMRPMPAIADRAAIRATTPMKILVADDNADSAQTLSVLLQLMGHDVRTAADGKDAIDTAVFFQPSVALLDIGMPKVDGYAAAKQIREMLPGTVLVAMTGWGQPSDVAKAKAAGFDHHLIKPVDPERLAALLATVQSTPPTG